MSEKRKTAVVVGDVMLDRCIVGTASRICPEAPVPVFYPQSTTETPGGAANVARNLAAMGVRTQLIGVVGDDPAGKQLHELLVKTEGVAPFLLAGLAQTTIKTRFVVAGYQLLRVDEEGRPQSRPEDVWNAFQLAMQRDDVGVVVVSDYDKGTLADLGPHIIAFCAQRRVPVFVDAKPATYGNYVGASLLKPNLSEALELCKEIVHPGLYCEQLTEQAETAAIEIRKKYRAGTVVVTAGSCGAAVAYDGGSTLVPTKNVAFADVVGAGDTTMAAIAASCVAGDQLLTAVKRGVAAGSIAVARAGTAVVTESELDDAVYQLDLPESKFMTFNQAAQFSRRRRTAGQAVGFVNGCFDCLHSGHVQLLQYARDKCRTLIVAVDTDESVRDLKGPTRPIMPLAQRAKMLEPFADALVCFHTSQLEELVRMVRPDVLVKGEEYKHRNLPGADFVANHGGMVLFAPMLQGFSTTAIAEALRGKPAV